MNNASVQLSKAKVDGRKPPRFAHRGMHRGPGSGKLQPYASVILEQFHKGKSYREVLAFLKEEHGMHASLGTLQPFLEVRDNNLRLMTRRGQPNTRFANRPFQAPHEAVESTDLSEIDQFTALRKRIASRATPNKPQIDETKVY